MSLGILWRRVEAGGSTDATRLMGHSVLRPMPVKSIAQCQVKSRGHAIDVSRRYFLSCLATIGGSVRIVWHRCREHIR